MHAYLADARNLPAWAPAFAEAVRRDGEHWTVTGDAEFAVDLLADPGTGTVAIVAVADRGRGAFARVLSNAEGSEFLFTLLFPPDLPEPAVRAQLATVERELAAVRAACR